MTGKAINSSATGLLVLILPIAFLIVLLFQAWPILLALFVISVSVKVWRQYQWERWSRQVNPYFNELIKENQGCLTPMDLSMKANLSGEEAQWYLDKKAEEFGTQRREYEGKGLVYYFLTASALGSIFEDSEPPPELEDSEDFVSLAPVVIEPSLQKEPHPSHHESFIREVTEPSHPSIEEEPVSSVELPQTEEVKADLELLEPQPLEPTESLKEKEDLPEESVDKHVLGLKPLIQAELAKRLDVHSSTVGKRKSDPDFPEWSQSRDPEGIAWEYSPKTKEFLPLEKIEL
jgi:hypothetical protein